jgi:hypothetical protein
MGHLNATRKDYYDAWRRRRASVKRDGGWSWYHSHLRVGDYSDAEAAADRAAKGPSWWAAEGYLCMPSLALQRASIGPGGDHLRPNCTCDYCRWLKRRKVQ